MGCAGRITALKKRCVFGVSKGEIGFHGGILTVQLVTIKCDPISTIGVIVTVNFWAEDLDTRDSPSRRRRNIDAVIIWVYTPTDLATNRSKRQSNTLPIAARCT